MKVKVHCPCGTRFEFEVEPVNDRMPVSINCPACGADATELANAVIQRQLAAPPAGAPPAAIRVTAPGASRPQLRMPAPVQPPAPAAGAPPAPVPSTLRIAKAAPAPAAPEAADENPPADAAPKPVPQKRPPAWEEKLRENELNPLVKRLILGVVGALAVAGAVWFWYVWFARNPKVVYSLDFPKAAPDSGGISYRPDAFYQLLAPNRLLSVKNQRVSLMDVTQQIAIWSAPFSGEDAFTQLHVVATTNDIWVAWPDKLMRLDRQTGQEKPLTLPDPVISVVPGDNMILVVSGNPPARETVTQFSLPDGTPQSEDVTAPPEPAKPPPRPIVTRPVAPGTVEEESEGTRQSAVAAIARAGVIMGRGNMAKAMSIPSDAQAPSAEPAFDHFDNGPQTVFDAGPNAVWFQTRLLEQREITVQAMKKPSGKSVLDSANLNASQGVDLAEEMVNNSQRERTGGVDIVDVSRYQVTLHRLFAHETPDWTGEFTGPPAFLPLKTVDLIIAGTNLAVFDKSNKQLWTARLTYPVSSAYGFADGHPPCLETADALYFADKGMLTRFDIATGSVRWRLTSVGISAVQADDHGRLYLDTTTMGGDAILYSQQINLRDRDLRVIMQVDAASGKILWRSDFPGSYYHAFVSGRFLYSARVWQTQDALRLEEGPDTHFNFKLLEPADGKMVWNYPLFNKQLIKAEVRQNWILLQFQDRVLVLKFFSL